ncbi:MAG: hypothetical protein IPL02_10595 [Moraxellaceae bacterium]|nr:hypothetical protein [Moraxellaceae bacterium]
MWVIKPPITFQPNKPPPHCAANETRVDEYVRHFKEDCWALPKQVRLCCD